MVYAFHLCSVFCMCFADHRLVSTTPSNPCPSLAADGRAKACTLTFPVSISVIIIQHLVLEINQFRPKSLQCHYVGGVFIRVSGVSWIYVNILNVSISWICLYREHVYIVNMSISWICLYREYVYIVNMSISWICLYLEYVYIVNMSIS